MGLTKRKRWVVLAGCLYFMGSGVLLGQTRPGGTGAAGVPTMGELNALVEKGEYREALKGLFRATELKGEAAMGYDRYELLMLRGECQLQLKEQPSARETFAAAKKEADAGEKVERSAKAGAMELLISRSTAFTYKANTGEEKDKEVVSILDRTKRGRAMQLLLADEMAGVKARYEAALKAKSLLRVMEFAKVASGVRSLELVAAGNNTKTTTMFADLAKHAAELMDAEGTAMLARAGAIKRRAEVLVTEQVDVVDPAGKRLPTTRIRRVGLTGADKLAIKQMAETSGKFAPAAKELGSALGTATGTFESAVKKAGEVLVECEVLMLTDYGVQVK